MPRHRLPRDVGPVVGVRSEPSELVDAQAGKGTVAGDDEGDPFEWSPPRLVVRVVLVGSPDFHAPDRRPAV